MKVEMLDTVEDTNGSVDDDTGAVSFGTDLLKKGKVYDLPKGQATRLVTMGFAKASK